MEGLGTLSRLGLEGLLLFMYLNYFSNGSFTAWRAAERFFAEFFGFPSITHAGVILCLHLSFPFS